MEKATRFVNANRSFTFVFCRTEQKKKELLKSKDFVCFSYRGNITFLTCLKPAEQK